MTTKETHLASLMAMLSVWTVVGDIQAHFNWRGHTARGRISDLGKTGIQIERKRVDGVTSYRIKPAEIVNAA